eukprot:6186561-Pleurochrysis_carterae.AAC.2
MTRARASVRQTRPSELSHQLSHHWAALNASNRRSGRARPVLPHEAAGLREALKRVDVEDCNGLSSGRRGFNDARQVSRK